ncbi:hypothetical protein [Actinomadura litoris]|uniref:hypothetical protein n=1 Tax=Actinomadura litoris TaxID=2678616 RepID=UPI001FA7105E|nr:hypothetical protein [Actinomadura litoris]
MNLYSEPATSQQLIGATADIITRQDAYPAALIRGHHADRLVLRLAEVWVQVNVSDITTLGTKSDIPLADTRAVRVADRGTSRSYEGIAIRTVQLVWTCPACGRPRGEPGHSMIVEDGEYYYVDAWSNTCGHIDMYRQVLVEAGWHPIQHRAVKA